MRYSYQFIDTEFTWNLVITSNAIKVELGNWGLSGHRLIVQSRAKFLSMLKIVLGSVFYECCNWFCLNHGTEKQSIYLSMGISTSLSLSLSLSLLDAKNLGSTEFYMLILPNSIILEKILKKCIGPNLLNNVAPFGI